MSSPTGNPALADTAWLDKFGLIPRQRAFVLACIADPNAKQAATDAGYTEGSGEAQGSRLFSNIKVARAIAEGRKQVESKAMLDAEGIVNLRAQIALADPNELTQHIIAPCRYCYGIDHQYQWKTEPEFTERKAEVIFSMFSDGDLRDAATSGIIADPRIPDDAGGYGYRLTDPPNPACPECSGMGMEITRMADTRKFSPAARLLFDGVKETKQGVEIKMQDRAVPISPQVRVLSLQILAPPKGMA